MHNMKSETSPAVASFGHVAGKDYALLLLVVAGLLLRLLFVWYGAALYYKGGNPAINFDTESYIRSFLTLWQLVYL